MRLHGRANRAVSARGQAAVELVAMLPLLFLVVLAVTQVLVAGLAREAARHAAQAGAMALLQGGDPVEEARAAAPDWSRRRLSVSVRGRSVRVRVVPPALLPGTAGLLASSASAAAGPSR